MKIDIAGIEPTGNGDGFHVRRADGQLVSKVDPVTKQATGEPQAFRIAEPRVPRFAEMSSQQRHQSLDNMAAQIADLTAANNAIVQRLNELLQQHVALKASMELIAERIDRPRSFLGRWFGIC